MDGLDAAGEKSIYKYQCGAYDQHIECEGDGVDPRHTAAHNSDDICCICHYGYECKCYTSPKITLCMVAPGKQCNANDGDGNGNVGHHRCLLLEKPRHSKRHNEGIEKVDGCGYSARNILVALDKDYCCCGI